MRFFAGFIFVLMTITFAQGQFSGVQLNNLQSLLTYSSQIQGLVNQLNTVLPQLSGVLSSGQIQSLSNQIVQLVVSQIGNKPTIDSLKNMLQPLLQQYLGTSAQGRIDFDALLQQVVSIVASALPGAIIGLLGKRDVAQVDGRDLSQILSLINNPQLNAILPQIQSFLSQAQFQQLQSQFLNIVLSAASGNWNLATVSQSIQQLFTQYVPQLSVMRIDWEAIGQSALEGLVSALPGALITLAGLFGKRDLNNIDIKQLLAQLPLNQLAQLVRVALNGDKSNVLSQLRNLFQQFLPSYSVRVNFDELATNFFHQINTLLPTLNQSILTAVLG